MTSYRIDIPTEGFYKRRFVKGGPWIPVHLFYGPPHDPVTGEVLDRSHRWQALVNGKEADPYETWISCASHPITQADYQYMLGVADWATKYAPSEPEANPRDPIDLGKLKPLF